MHSSGITRKCIISDITTDMRLCMNFSSHVTSCRFIFEHDASGYTNHYTSYNTYLKACSTRLVDKSPTIRPDFVPSSTECVNVESLRRILQFPRERFNAKASLVHIHGFLNAVEQFQPKPLPHFHSFLFLPPVILSAVWSNSSSILHRTHMQHSN